MTMLLKASDLTQEKFLDLIQNLTFKDVASDEDISPCYIWIQAPDGWALDKWNRESGFESKIRWYGAGRESMIVASRDCLRKSTSGRLFGPDGELRWRNIPMLAPSCWRTVFLGNVDWVGEVLEDSSDCLSHLQLHQDSFFLWGQLTETAPDEWIELRIPHRFQYPVDEKPNRVKIITQQWRDDTGEPHFVRLCNLESEEED